LAYQFTAVTALVHNETVILNVFSKEGIGVSSHTGFEISYENSTVKSSGYTATTSSRDNVRRTEIAIPLNILNRKASKSNTITLTIGFDDLSQGTERISLDDITYLYSDAVSNSSDLIYSVKFTPTPTKNIYAYSISVTSNKGFSARNYIYVNSKDYFITNSKTSLIDINPELLNQYGDKNIGFAPKTSSTRSFTGSIGEFGMGKAPQNGTGGTGGSVLVVTTIKGGPEFDPQLPVLKVCGDPNANNYYLASPWPTGCTETNSINNFANQSAANSASDIYTLVQQSICCTYDNADDAFFVVDVDDFQSPEGVASSGYIDLSWSGGTPPYDLNFTCPPSDTTCSNSAFDATNTSNTSLQITNLSGTTLPTQQYTFSVTDANGLVETASVSGIVTLEAQASVNCHIASAVNYLAEGVGEADVCRWCHNTSGVLHTNTNDNTTDAVNIIKIHDVEISDPTRAFNLNSTSLQHATSTNNDGSFTLNVSFATIVDNTTSADYSFNLDDSVEIDGSGGVIKLERKTLFVTNASADALYDQVSADPYNSVLYWSLGTSEATPTTTTYASTTTITGGLTANLPGGAYIYKISYVDSNSTHELEGCASYLIVQVLKIGCNDPTAFNYIGADTYSLFYDTNPSSCYGTPASSETLQTTVDDMFTWTLAYQNTEAMEACEFKMYFTYQLGNVTSPTLQAYTNIAWSLQATASSFLQTSILYEYCQRVLNLNYIPIGVYISNFSYFTTYYTINQSTGATVANTVLVSPDQTEWSYSDTQTAIHLAQDEDEGLNGIYNFQETTSFGTTVSSINSNVGTQLGTLHIEISGDNGLMDICNITLLPNGPQVFSIVEVNESGGLGDYLTGENLCQECESAFDYLYPGCTDPIACNYDSTASVDDGTCAGYVGGFPAIDGAGNWTSLTGNYGSPCGCTDPTYIEYSEVSYEFTQTYPEYGDEIFPTGSVATACITTQSLGCTDPTFMNYDPSATEDDGTCSELVVNGCTDTSACNYEPSANTNDGTCYYEVEENCHSFNNWSIVSQIPPDTCAGTGTSSGSFTISNTSYSGPVSFRFVNTNNTVGIDEGDNVQLSGTNYLGFSSVIDDGNFLSTQGIDNGVTIVSTQTGGGTSFLVSNIDAGLYTIYILSGDQPLVNSGIYSGACVCHITDIDGELTALFNSGEFSGMDDVSGGFNLNISASGARALGDGGACGCCDPASGTYDSSIDPATGNGSCNQSLCADYGCTDSEANNYNEFASLPCTDPSTQNGANGEQCNPCKYGFIDNLYSPAFCMPANTEQQLQVIRKCIGTAGTNAFINTITGKSDCVTRDAWKLILVEYLMSKKGLDCIYNCADPATPSTGEFKTCKAKAANTLPIVEHLSLGIIGSGSRRYKVGETYKYNYSAEVSGTTREKFYTLKYLESSDSLHVSGTQLEVFSTSSSVYTGMALPDLPYIKYAPGVWPGWVLCEEPPTKPHSKNYLGKFINFVQNYCRQCQLPVSNAESGKTVEVESVITINGIVITVNNSNLK